MIITVSAPRKARTSRTQNAQSLILGEDGFTPWRGISSSNLSFVRYRPADTSLEVQFQSGAVYQYTGVPESVYAGLLSAPSAGSYLAQQIKQRFPHSRVR